MSHPVVAENRFEYFPDENNGKTVRGLCKVYGSVGYGSSTLHYLYEPTLVKCHILRDNPEDIKEEGVNRAENSLRPIVKDRNLPRLPFFIRNQDKSPTRKRRGSPLLPPIEELVIIRNPPIRRRNPAGRGRHRRASV